MNRVEDFFKSNPGIREVAFAARKKLLSPAYFPGASIYFRYDYDNTARDLVWIIIHTKSLFYEEAYSRLDQFDKNWWVAQLPRTQGKLSIMIHAREE